jgi:hypothetical protein
MTHLLVLDGERFRDATPAEIFRCAESLDLSPTGSFPHPYTVHTRQEVELIARWCVAPLTAPCLLCVLLNAAGEVMQYQQLPPYASDAILERLITLSAPTYRADRIWVLSVQPGAPSSAADQLGDCLQNEFTRRGCKNMRYLRIVADQLPPVCVAQRSTAQTPFWVVERAERRRAAAQEVLTVAKVLCAHRLERGQVLKGTTDSQEILQLCVTPQQSPLGIALLDAQDRFLDYRNIRCALDGLSYASTAEMLEDWQAMAEQVRAMQATGGILVRAHRGRWVDLNELEIKVISRLIKLLWQLEIATYACAVVGTDGVEFYRTYQPLAVKAPAALVH